MKHRLIYRSLTRVSTILAVAIVIIPNAPGQQNPSAQEVQDRIQQTLHQEKLQQVLQDKAGYAAGIVSRCKKPQGRAASGMRIIRSTYRPG